MKAESMQTKDNLCIRNQENGLEHLRKKQKKFCTFSIITLQDFRRK